MRSRRPSRRSDPRVIHQAAAWCLGYPDAALLERVPMLRGALAEQPGDDAALALMRFVEHLAATAPVALVRDYVDVFDLSSKHTLYLSYWTDGDTRRRGETLAGFKQRYRDAGLLVNTHGELPDYLPMVLEYAALADPEAGRALLQEYRASLELIRLSLVDRGSPYGDVLTAVCATLPGASPRDRAAAMALARTGPPTETVGLEPLPYPVPRAEGAI
ncbi:nitrate reductase molybdenum cofactor assembly chaperone [Nocardioides sp. GY 10113]|uniref:nitrate reductase molybdenum cofactor assembly chaperone n=1 Tax=Nocardioides sp. GY 10113 TaxID=2569761 RepID=UPI0010A7BD66|nr:nitrate reductase molybdenum cofactor assembly chaperone [Nocardioides sp. GY 10113]TIC80403.1 nitrate reductase molybdenum cofactor assembly chaperone [Nocardioides sp. GY 10113]TIC82436.1 nitrate reductase molybdenum cofactor assembly chaperone [Nocardioides sp. GY 10113]